MTTKKPEPEITVEVPNMKFVEGPTLTVEVPNLEFVEGLTLVVPLPNLEFSEPVTIAKVPCPFIYSTGKKCQGHIVRIEAYKADITWTLDGTTGTWKFSWMPRSHYHLFCSLKSNHAGWERPDSEQMKFYFDKLPEKLQAVIKPLL